MSVTNRRHNVLWVNTTQGPNKSVQFPRCTPPPLGITLTDALLSHIHGNHVISYAIILKYLSILFSQKGMFFYTISQHSDFGQKIDMQGREF